jgi:hypothetical protein
MSSHSVSLPHATIEHRIVVIRGQRVMLDDDLARSTAFPPSG